MTNSKGLIILKKANSLCLDISELTINFPVDNNSELIGQLKNVSTLILTNITQVNANKTPLEFDLFTKNVFNAITEVTNLLKTSRNLNFISEKDFQLITEKAKTIRRMLYNLKMSRIK